MSDYAYQAECEMWDAIAASDRREPAPPDVEDRYEPEPYVSLEEFERANETATATAAAVRASVERRPFGWSSGHPEGF